MLLEEAGLQPEAKWLLAEGADSAHMSRSIPLEKALDDAMIALYQNGERLRPEQGYPVRLLLPGWEGNMSVKWLRRLKATEGPTHTKDETSKYTDPAARWTRVAVHLRDGREVGDHPAVFDHDAAARRASTRSPASPGAAPGASGASKYLPTAARPGSMRRSPAKSAPSAWCAFDCRGNGPAQAAVLQSRATDEKGRVQPPRKEWLARYCAGHPLSQQFHRQLGGGRRREREKCLRLSGYLSPESS